MSCIVPLAVAARLNNRFLKGGLSSNIEEAGVIIHQFDRTEDPFALYKPCPKEGAGGACPLDVRDRVSTSIIFQGMKNGRKEGTISIFQSVAAGVVFHPRNNLVLCGFGADGGSRGVTCGGGGAGPPYRDGDCVPGCTNSNMWCDPSTLREDAPAWCDGRPWRPVDFKELFRHFSLTGRNEYNEVTLDTVTWEQQLPWSIEAFFYPETALTACADPGDIKSCHPDLHDLHDMFLAEFKVTADEVPLLRLRIENWDEPFAVG